MSPRRAVRMWQLGVTSYDTAWELQRALARRQLAGGGGGAGRDTLLLVEHKPVYTVGIRDKTSPSEVSRLQALGAEFRKTNRGGLITFHGPGQLVVYPIINLKNFEPSVKWYVCRLEETIIQLCKEYGLNGTRSPHTGVWIGDNKIAAIGIHASRYITTHGVSLNCDTDLSWFDNIVPCGIPDKGVTSLSKETGRNLGIEEVTPVFTSCFEKVFGCKIELISPNDQADVLNSVYSNLMTGRIS